MSASKSAAKARNEPAPGHVALGRLGDFVGFRLRRVQNQLSRNFAAVTAEEGLKSGLFSSLAIIGANPGLSQNELSHEVGLDKSVTVTMIDEMERNGWAERRRAPEDRRRHALFITEAGQAKLDRLFTLMEETESAVLHQLSEGELALLSELLDRMYDAVVRDEG
ncbi:winged helix-turn-helix transcriptional regulator [Novosphingobium flavum]|uniref:Winged helix-turn-helix transcriptional regulator n=1 Tax=Novosphingobium flavum TaxID=1778672 RepID=A0A7X1FRD6_9SPHN|nr:MarR family winged helix-turn-helix transcriptional regulator [Novosphingobium flavum]MBC2665424.1 winged helix-turn-helix transcriptional regulator [Novosphingobium flavum]